MMDPFQAMLKSRKLPNSQLQNAAPGEMNRVEIGAHQFNSEGLVEGGVESAQVLTQSTITSTNKSGSQAVDVENDDGNFNKQDENNVLATTAQVGLPPMVPVTDISRPYKLTPELQQQVCLLLEAGFSRRQAASYVHVDQSTVAHAMKRDPEFAAAVVRAEELSSLQMHLCLVAASRKNWRAAAWLLEHKRKYPAPPTPEEKQARDEERLADIERQQEFRRRERELQFQEKYFEIHGRLPNKQQPSPGETSGKEKRPSAR